MVWSVIGRRPRGTSGAIARTTRESPCQIGLASYAAIRVCLLAFVVLGFAAIHTTAIAPGGEDEPAGAYAPRKPACRDDVLAYRESLWSAHCS
jgi:hypothetical protein